MPLPGRAYEIEIGPGLLPVLGERIVQPGDVIVAIDGEPIQTLDDLNLALNREPGRWDIEIDRNGRRINGYVTL